MVINMAKKKNAPKLKMPIIDMALKKGLIVIYPNYIVNEKEEDGEVKNNDENNVNTGEL